MFCRAGLISTAVASFAQGQRVGVRPERNNHSPVHRLCKTAKIFLRLVVQKQNKNASLASWVHQIL